MVRRSRSDRTRRRLDRRSGYFFERWTIRDSREWVGRQATGRTLEIGVGTGLNLRWYQADIELVAVDLDSERDEALRTLVVANQTVGGEPLMRLLREKAEERPRRFIVIAPQSGEPGAGGAPERLAHMLKELEDEGLDAIGQVMHPDPFTAIQNALQFYAPDDIVISTFPETRSGWMRSDLIGRVQASTGKPVEHVVSEES